MGKNLALVAGVGDGQTTNVANQTIVALNTTAVAEALLFAARPAPTRAWCGRPYQRHGSVGHLALVRTLELKAGHQVAPDASDASDASETFLP